MKLFLGLLFLSFQLVFTAAFSRWPVFAVPDREFLLAHYVDTLHCEAGKGRIISGDINIHEKLCKSFCPMDWHWVIQSDNQCHDLRELTSHSIAITHVSDAEGVTDYSVIDANYGVQWLSLLFRSNAGEHWYCIDSNEEMRFITCANDL